MTSYLRTLRLFNRNVRLYLLVAGLMGLTVYGGINAVVFNLYVIRLGYGPEFVGMLNASSWLALAVFSLPAGRLGRRFGPRRLMIGGQALIAASLCLLPLATFSGERPLHA